MVRRNQRNIARPLQRHNIVQSVVRRRRIRPLIRHPHAITGTPRSSLRQHRPLRCHSRCIRLIPPRQRHIARPRKRHHIVQRHRQPPQHTRPESSAPKPRRAPAAQPGHRTSRPRSSWYLPSGPAGPVVPPDPPETIATSSTAACAVRSFSLLSNCTTAVPAVSATPLFVAGAVWKNPGRRRHIHRHVSPGLAHRKHLRRTPQRRKRRKSNAVLAPRPIHRLHTHQPARVRPIAIQPQRRPRHLRRRSSPRQRRKIKLQQRRIPATDIQIRNRSAVHRRPGAVHMSIRHQRRPPPQTPASPQPTPPQALSQPEISSEPGPSSPSRTALGHANPCVPRTISTFNDPNSAMHVAGKSLIRPCGVP